MRARSWPSLTLLATTTTRPWRCSSATAKARWATSMERRVGSTTTTVASTAAASRRVRVPIPASRSATTVVASSFTEPSNCSADSPHQGQPGSGFSMRVITDSRTPSGASAP
ncbi:MAG: hypothetical protein F4118_04220 [Acidimicrobiaceae bacterium]|nr:hypothetical protein [Acidimicrobiaceae bacterium]MYI35620.1 hypothetical protein [Acidimicrobiaceae bacterium]